MTRSLLPPNSTFLEHRLAQVGAALTDLDGPIRPLWNPATCPVVLLPYLAWTLSVERWQVDAPENIKRQAIRTSFMLHQRKGTVSALRQVLEPLGYQISVTQWWERQPHDPAGTFRLHVHLPTDAGLSDAQLQEIERLIEDVKPVSRHVIGLAMGLTTGAAAISMAAAQCDGDVLTIYPWMRAEIRCEGALQARSTTYVGETLSIFPDAAEVVTSGGVMLGRAALHTIDMLYLHTQVPV